MPSPVSLHPAHRGVQRPPAACQGPQAHSGAQGADLALPYPTSLHPAHPEIILLPSLSAACHMTHAPWGCALMLSGWLNPNTRACCGCAAQSRCPPGPRPLPPPHPPPPVANAQPKVVLVLWDGKAAAPGPARPRGPNDQGLAAEGIVPVQGTPAASRPDMRRGAGEGEGEGSVQCSRGPARGGGGGGGQQCVPGKAGEPQAAAAGTHRCVGCSEPAKRRPSP